VIASKSDLLGDPAAEMRAFRELSGLAFPSITYSTSGSGDAIGRFLFEYLDLVRVYTRTRSGDDDDKPFVLRRGSTVHDVALLVHKDVAAALKYARVWGGGVPGQQVGRDHVVADGDIVELH
jgi:ribosome-interacting GTPase 1